MLAFTILMAVFGGLYGITKMQEIRSCREYSDMVNQVEETRTELEKSKSELRKIK